jgi:peptidylprolyl isomerase
MAGPDDIQYTDTVVGTGKTATDRHVALVKYTGTFSDGTAINGATANTQPVEISLVEQTTIPGFRNGILGILQSGTGTPMKVGGQRRITIPPAMAYGALDPANPDNDPKIKDQWPPNVPIGNLIFDVELEDLLRLHLKGG